MATLICLEFIWHVHADVPLGKSQPNSQEQRIKPPKWADPKQINILENILCLVVCSNGIAGQGCSLLFQTVLLALPRVCRVQQTKNLSLFAWGDVNLSFTKKSSMLLPSVFIRQERLSFWLRFREDVVGWTSASFSVLGSSQKRFRRFQFPVLIWILCHFEGECAF